MNVLRAALASHVIWINESDPNKGICMELSDEILRGEIITLLIWHRASREFLPCEANVLNSMELFEFGLRTLICRSAPQLMESPILQITACELLPDFVQPIGWFIVSRRLRQIIESFDVPGEFFRCELRSDHQPASAVEYFFFNILDSVECFDFEASEYRMATHGVDGISRLVLNDEQPVGHHLFRVGQIPSPQHNPRAVQAVLICASEQLARAVIAAGCTGVHFVLPKDY